MINEALKSSILDKLVGIQYTDIMSVSTVEVSDTISTLKKGKACGPDLLRRSSLLIIKCMFCYLCVFLHVCLMVIYHNL